MLCSSSAGFTQSETTVNCVSGGHRYTIRTFAALKKEPAHSVSSSTFKVGIHQWQIVCYPGGETEDVQEYVSLFLGYKGPYLKCSATWKLKCLNQIRPEDSRERLWAKGDRYNTFTKGRRWGWQKFLKRDVVTNPVKGFLVDDTLIFESTIDVHIQTETVSTSRETKGLRSLLYPIPKSALYQDYQCMLKNDEFADVVFSLDEGRSKLKAHSQILAARSPVLARALSARHRKQSERYEHGRKVIEVPDISPHVFSEMLFFIYSDRLTWFGEDTFDEDKKAKAPQTPEKKERLKSEDTEEEMHSSSRRGKKRKLDVSEKGGEDAVPDSPTKDVHNYETVCALFEAADKYEVNRLRLLCEHILTTMLSPASIQHILNVADKHGAAQLKKICLDFIAQNPDELIGSDAFSSLDPSMMKQLVACVLARQKGTIAITSMTSPVGCESLLDGQNIDLHQVRRELALRGISSTGGTDELVDRLRAATQPTED